jgi:superfamily II DNA or RNA helicase
MSQFPSHEPPGDPSITNAIIQHSDLPPLTQLPDQIVIIEDLKPPQLLSFDHLKSVNQIQELNEDLILSDLSEPEEVESPQVELDEVESPQVELDEVEPDEEDIPTIAELQLEPSKKPTIKIKAGSVPPPLNAIAIEDLPPFSAENIYAQLLAYQVPHVKHLLEVLKTRQSALDASNPGIGKTYSATAISALLKLQLFVVCPKSVINIWRKVAKLFRVKILGVSNYESLKICIYYDSTGSRGVCPYIEVLDGGEGFKWKLPEETMVIFDEVHKCKNIKSANSKLLTSSKYGSHKILMLSATVADKPEYMANVSYILDICTNIRIFSIYLKSLKMLNPSDSTMMALHKKIFPHRGARLKIEDLGDLFPRNQIVPETYTMDEDIEKQIQQQYELLNVAVQDLKKKESEATCYLARIIRIRQKIEALKVKAFLELIQDFRDNGYSVVVFTNYRDTLNLLENKLNTGCLIHGQQTLAERDLSVDSFQNNTKDVILCQIQAGGVGISLHDIHGGHPRVALISPTWSAQDLVQALGRIHRANGKTPCLQRIIFCANTIEEQIAENLQVKINNYAQINDGKDKSEIQVGQTDI